LDAENLITNSRAALKLSRCRPSDHKANGAATHMIRKDQMKTTGRLRPAQKFYALAN
jgi:hypothetical protein